MADLGGIWGEHHWRDANGKDSTGGAPLEGTPLTWKGPSKSPYRATPLERTLPVARETRYGIHVCGEIFSRNTYGDVDIRTGMWIPPPPRCRQRPTIPSTCDPPTKSRQAELGNHIRGQQKLTGRQLPKGNHQRGGRSAKYSLMWFVQNEKCLFCFASV